MAERKGTGREQKVAAADAVAPTATMETSGKPVLGGADGAVVTFTDQQIAILKAASDEIIPPGGGFPAPSTVRVVEDFMPRYITPRGEQPQHYPFVAEADFKASVDALGQRFLDTHSAKRVEILRATERDDPTFFLELKSLVYYGYYSRPVVTDAIRQNLEAGRDYRGAPQPYGYARCIEDWDMSKLPRGRGRYTPTAEVKRVAVRPSGSGNAGSPAMVGATRHRD
jgi:hypothetical protein